MTSLTFFVSLLCKADRGFHVAVGLSSDKISQMMSKCGENISDTLSSPCVPLFCFYPQLT